jgi:hypothetical protein
MPLYAKYLVLNDKTANAISHFKFDIHWLQLFIHDTMGNTNRRTKSNISVRVSRPFIPVKNQNNITCSIHLRRLACGRLGSSTAHTTTTADITEAIQPSTSNCKLSSNDQLHEETILDDYNIGIDDDFNAGINDHEMEADHSDEVDQENKLTQKIKVCTQLTHIHNS